MLSLAHWPQPLIARIFQASLTFPPPFHPPLGRYSSSFIVPYPSLASSTMAAPAIPPGTQPSSPQIHRSLSEPPPSHQPDPLDPMNYEYPDLAGSVHAVFDTQLPGAAIDPTQSSQNSHDEPGDSGSGGLPPSPPRPSRRAEKAPARDPPSFGLFGASQDRTQDLFFPPTIGSQNRFVLPEPTSPLPYLVQVTATLPGRFENISRRFQDVEAALHKCNARVDSTYHLHETLHEAQMEASNKCYRIMEHILSEFNNLVSALNQGRRPTRPPTPLPNRPAPPTAHPTARTTEPIHAPPPAVTHSPTDATNLLAVPEVVITAPARPPLPTSGPSTAATRTRLPRKSAEGPKNYVDKPLTPSPQSSPDPLNPPTVAGPSRPAPNYAAAAAAGGAFQPVISRRNRNHRNRSSRTTAGSPPSDIRARQLVVIRHDQDTPLTPTLCMSIVNNIRARLRTTTCPSLICEVKSSAKGNLVLTTDSTTLAQDVWPFWKHIILGLNDSRIGPFDLALNQQRLPLYISNVPLSYPRGGSNRSWHPDDWDTAALERLKIDISSSNGVEAVDRPFAIGTLAGMKSNNREHCAFVVNLIRNPASEELARSELAAVAGRRVFCREWFPDAHRSYCDRCLSPGHHLM